MARIWIVFAVLFFAVPARAVPCGTLFGDTGTILPGLAADECTERQSFSEGGRTHTIYDASRFGYAGRDWHVTLAREAIQRSIATYSALTRVPAITMIFGGSPAPATRTDTAAAILGETFQKIYGERCVFYLTDPNFGGGYDSAAAEASVKVSIAHEIFHCVQYYNWERKVTGAMWANAAWWGEGTAGYYEHWVYPEYPPSPRRAPALDAAIQSAGGIFDLQHPNEIFFAYAAEAFGGARGLIGVIERMPEAPGIDEQRAALAGVAGMSDEFQRFAQRYLNRDIAAPGGHRYDLNPVFPAAETISEPGEKSIPVPPWTVQPRVYLIPRGENWRITLVEAQGRSKVAARYEETRTWSQLPFEVTACASDRRVVVAATAAEADGGVRRVKIKFERRSGEARECPCPLGHWTVKRNDIDEHYPLPAAGNVPGTTDRPWKLRLSEGAPSLDFRADGTAEYSHFLTFKGEPRTLEVAANCTSQACVRACSIGARSRDFCAPKRRTYVNIKAEDTLNVSWTWRRERDMLIRRVTAVSGGVSLFNYDGFGWRLFKTTPRSVVAGAASGNPFTCSGSELQIGNTPASASVSDVDALIAQLEAGNEQQRAVAAQLRAARDRRGGDPATRELMDRTARGEGLSKPAYPFSGRFVR